MNLACSSQALFLAYVVAGNEVKNKSVYGLA